MEQKTRSEFLASAKTIGASAEPLTVTGLKAWSYVLICADGENTGTIYVGHNATVDATNGFPLGAGESVEVPIDDAGKVWVIASDSGQVVKYLII